MTSSYEPGARDGQSAPAAGDVRLVFDPVEWGGRDKGDNSQFWHPATLVEVHGEFATVRFHHDRAHRHSRGHFIASMREIEDV